MSIRYGRADGPIAMPWNILNNCNQNFISNLLFFFRNKMRCLSLYVSMVGVKDCPTGLGHKSPPQGLEIGEKLLWKKEKSPLKERCNERDYTRKYYYIHVAKHKKNMDKNRAKWVIEQKFRGYRHYG